MSTSENINIGGREFRRVEESTLAHDVWMRRQLIVAGLDRLHMVQGESADQFARRVLAAIATDGAVFELLGGLLIPAEFHALNWTPEIAAATGAFLRVQTDPAAKKQITGLIASLIQGFLRAELILLELIPKSSVLSAAARARVSPSTVLEQPITGESGPDSFVN